jgi:hypothetical protein
MRRPDDQQLSSGEWVEIYGDSGGVIRGQSPHRHQSYRLCDYTVFISWAAFDTILMSDGPRTYDVNASLGVLGLDQSVYDFT